MKLLYELRSHNIHLSMLIKYGSGCFWTKLNTQTPDDEYGQQLEFLKLKLSNFLFFFSHFTLRNKRYIYVRTAQKQETFLPENENV
jgi:hypothetical protein